MGRLLGVYIGNIRDKEVGVCVGNIMGIEVGIYIGNIMAENYASL
jgi:hypothetical protein